MTTQDFLGAKIPESAFNFLQQQERFDFVRVYNHQRPHRALGGAYPGDIYASTSRRRTPSTRTMIAPSA